VAQRRHHYERAFESYLRSNRVPYIAVDEAKKALLPRGSELRARVSSGGDSDEYSLKSFDFVIYRGDQNLLVDVKGRKIGARRPGQKVGRLESWVTLEDLESLQRWEVLFGQGFRGSLVFVYWCEAQPPDALYQEVFEDHGRWYAVREVSIADYARHMRVRSSRWGTVHLHTEDFERISRPLLTRF